MSSSREIEICSNENWIMGDKIGVGSMHDVYECFPTAQNHLPGVDPNYQYVLVVETDSDLKRHAQFLKGKLFLRGICNLPVDTYACSERYFANIQFRMENSLESEILKYQNLFLQREEKKKSVFSVSDRPLMLNLAKIADLLLEAERLGVVHLDLHWGNIMYFRDHKKGKKDGSFTWRFIDLETISFTSDEAETKKTRNLFYGDLGYFPHVDMVVLFTTIIISHFAFAFYTPKNILKILFQSREFVNRFDQVFEDKKKVRTDETDPSTKVFSILMRKDECMSNWKELWKELEVYFGPMKWKSFDILRDIAWEDFHDSMTDFQLSEMEQEAIKEETDYIVDENEEDDE